jgi:hypothetical protein
MMIESLPEKRAAERCQLRQSVSFCRFSSQPGQDQKAETLNASPKGMALLVSIPINKGNIIAIRPETGMMDAVESGCFNSQLVLGEVEWACEMDGEQGFPYAIGVKFIWVGE